MAAFERFSHPLVSESGMRDTRPAALSWPVSTQGGHWQFVSEVSSSIMLGFVGSGLL